MFVSQGWHDHVDCEGRRRELTLLRQAYASRTEKDRRAGVTLLRSCAGALEFGVLPSPTANTQFFDNGVRMARSQFRSLKEGSD